MSVPFSEFLEKDVGMQYGFFTGNESQSGIYNNINGASLAITSSSRLQKDFLNELQS